MWVGVLFENTLFNGLQLRANPWHDGSQRSALVLYARFGTITHHEDPWVRNANANEMIPSVAKPVAVIRSRDPRDRQSSRAGNHDEQGVGPRAGRCQLGNLSNIKRQSRVEGYKLPRRIALHAEEGEALCEDDPHGVQAAFLRSH